MSSSSSGIDLRTCLTRYAMMTSLFCSNASGARRDSCASTATCATSLSGSTSSRSSAIDYVLKIISPIERCSLRALRTSTTWVHSCSPFFMHVMSLDANFACLGLASITNRMTRSTVRLSHRQLPHARPRTTNHTHLSLGAIFASHIAAAASACKHTSTSRAFFSSAIAFENSPICALYNAGQCFETNVIHVCAACAACCVRPSGSAPPAQTEND